jgi:hypothetical protein
MLLENILLLLDLIYYLSRGLMLPKEKKKTFIMTVVSCRSDLLSFKGGNSTKREQENIYHDLFLVDQIYYRSREVIQPKEKKTFIITVVSEITRFHEYG